ncbi:MAG: fibronectin type III domain-containing protein [Chitinispirillaceae bacterium]
MTGTSGDLNVVLTWDPVPSTLGYGVYYNKGPAVSKNDYYRVAYSNEYTLTALDEGEEYTFAVTYGSGEDETSLCEPVTVVVEEQ